MKVGPGLLSLDCVGHAGLNFGRSSTGAGKVVEEVVERCVVSSARGSLELAAVVRTDWSAGRTLLTPAQGAPTEGRHLLPLPAWVAARIVAAGPAAEADGGLPRDCLAQKARHIVPVGCVLTSVSASNGPSAIVGHRRVARPECQPEASAERAILAYTKKAALSYQQHPSAGRSLLWGRRWSAYTGVVAQGWWGLAVVGKGSRSPC